MKDRPCVMVLDDEPIVGERLKDAFEKEGIAVEVFTESAQAVARLKETSFAAVVTDMKMRGPSGIDVLRLVKESSPSTHVFVITGYATIEMNHEAKAHGAYQFVAKPFKTQELVKQVLKAIKSA